MVIRKGSFDKEYFNAIRWAMLFLDLKRSIATLYQTKSVMKSSYNIMSAQALGSS